MSDNSNMEHGAEGSAEVEVVRSFWRLWAARDKAGVVALLADDYLWALYVPEDVLPFGGETRGKAAASDRFQMILDQFYTLKFEGEVIRVEGQTVHGRVAYCFRHKVTGEAIDGVMRLIVVVRNGLMSSWHEYHDTERVRAFMRLVSYIAHKS